MTYPQIRAHAVRWARDQIRHPKAPTIRNGRPNTAAWRGWCQTFGRMAVGAPGGSPDAITAWRRADKRDRHPLDDRTPPGVLLYWAGGEHGHCAVYTGKRDGVHMCVSTDIKRRGLADEVPVGMVHDRWGYTVLGWLSKVNGRRFQGTEGR